MNKKLLRALQKRNNQRLTELRGQLEKNEVREADLESVQVEVQDLVDELQEIADTLANSDEGDAAEGNGDGSGEGEDRDADTEGEDEEGSSGEDEGEKRSGISVEQRDGIMTKIAGGLSTRGHKSTKTKVKEIRSAFANFVIGNISET